MNTKETMIDHVCHHPLNGQEDTLCLQIAMNKCRECKEFYCDEHFNAFMNLCDADSEVEAAKFA